MNSQSPGRRPSGTLPQRPSRQNLLVLRPGLLRPAFSDMVELPARNTCVGGAAPGRGVEYARAKTPS